MSQAYRVQFDESCIQPLLDFSSMVWRGACEANKLQLFWLQKCACWVILDYNVENPAESTEFFKNFVHIWLSFPFLRKIKFMIKVYNNLTPSYILENFSLRNEIDSSLTLRSWASGYFVTPKQNMECFKESLWYSECLTSYPMM